ncbi:hypothetical protein P8452_53686 [Trifolium repens]|nr:hypothetical protein P8452_53686 [Trifolium repens]
MEKQRKEAFELQTLNVILAAMNKLLTEENDRLQKEVSQLVNENEFMRQQVNTITTDASVDGSDIAGFVNKLLTEENDRLQKEVSQLENENEFMRQQVNIMRAAASADGSDIAGFGGPY